MAEELDGQRVAYDSDGDPWFEIPDKDGYPDGLFQQGGTEGDGDQLTLGQIADQYGLDRVVEIAAERERDLLLWLHAEAVHWQEFESAAAQSAEEDNNRLRLEHKWLRREVEFEVHGERWGNAIVGREGHEYVNGGNACACGTPCPSLGDWQRHLAASRLAEGRPLCACTIDYSALDHTRWTPPQCTVHPVSDSSQLSSTVSDGHAASVLPDGEAQPGDLAGGVVE